MTTSKTIALAKAHVANGNTDGALAILTAELARAGSSRTWSPLYGAKMAILDRMVNKTVALSMHGDRE